MKPTIILVHGEFAESSSWNGVMPRLLAEEHRVIACAVPLRSVRGDAEYLEALVSSVKGPMVLVGHSYGGAVITNLKPSAGEVVAAVYIAGFALERGESCVEASSLAPGSTFAETLLTVPLAAGALDAYIAQEKFHDQFAADLPREQTAQMAVSQRPVTMAALAEPSTDHPLWRTVPTWFVYGELAATPASSTSPRISRPTRRTTGRGSQ